MKRIGAALTLFTRLPLWKWTEIPSSEYSYAVTFWPLTGWLTGGTTAAILWIAGNLMPITPAVILALVWRVLLTGALHEDGFADFCDGFGGGKNKEQILTIMKDSHIGTYGVMGLILYFFLYFAMLTELPLYIAIASVIAIDVFSKACASQITNFLPYARKEGAKNLVTYSPMSRYQIFIVIITGSLPVLVLSFINIYLLFSVLFPIMMLTGLIQLMRSKIGGYTGDCCGATFLLCEISMLLGITVILNLF